MAKSKFIVSLTGGLGNQLFQLAASMNISDDTEVLLTSAYGSPRAYKNLTPDIFAFSLPRNVKMIENRPASWVVKKCVGYNLRMGMTPRNYEKFKYVKWLIEIVTKLILYFDLHDFYTLVVGKGVGFCKILKSNKNSLLVGYFQSYKWALNSKVLEELMAIKPREESNLQDNLILKANIEKPLFVHVRLGDYKKEEKIGILLKTYYFNAIKSQMSSRKYTKIWLFSDELETAISYIPDEYKDYLFKIPEIDGPPALTLELLRHGSGYVIANSSFSWWGAFLSYNKDARVIAPYPWFKDMDSPHDLIPPNWETLNPW